jgi:phosphoserine phosphatase
MFKSPPGMTAYCDIDSTLIEWDNPDTTVDKSELVEITTRGITGVFRINKYNLEYIKKLAVRGHAIVLWSKAGPCWAEAVAFALEIDDIVCACLAKPDYYIDDIQDPKEFMGKWVFHDIKGKRQGFMSKEHNKEEDK